jgi:hypothetical protein
VPPPLPRGARVRLRGSAVGALLPSGVKLGESMACLACVARRVALAGTGIMAGGAGLLGGGGCSTATDLESDSGVSKFMFCIGTSVAQVGMASSSVYIEPCSEASC